MNGSRRVLKNDFYHICLFFLFVLRYYISYCVHWWDQNSNIINKHHVLRHKWPIIYSRYQGKSILEERQGYLITLLYDWWFILCSLFLFLFQQLRNSIQRTRSSYDVTKASSINRLGLTYSGTSKVCLPFNVV